MIYDSNFEIVGPHYKLGASKHFSTDNDSIKERIYIDKAITLISEGELQRAEIILTKIY